MASMKSETYADKTIRFEHAYKSGRGRREQRYVIARFRNKGGTSAVEGDTKAEAYKRAKKLIDHQDVIGWLGVERMNAAKARGARRLTDEQKRTYKFYRSS